MKQVMQNNIIIVVSFLMGVSSIRCGRVPAMNMKSKQVKGQVKSDDIKENSPANKKENFKIFMWDGKTFSKINNSVCLNLNLTVKQARPLIWSSLPHRRSAYIVFFGFFDSSTKTFFCLKESMNIGQYLLITKKKELFVFNQTKIGYLSNFFKFDEIEAK